MWPGYEASISSQVSTRPSPDTQLELNAFLYQMEFGCVVGVSNHKKEASIDALYVSNHYTTAFCHLQTYCCSYNYMMTKTPQIGGEQLGDCRLFSGKASQVLMNTGFQHDISLQQIVLAYVAWV